jgi:hypothetical protein
MPRKGPAPRRELMPDPIYRSVVVTQLVNKVMQRGKRSTAERIVYSALDIVADKAGTDDPAILKRPSRTSSPSSRFAAVASVAPPTRCRSRSSPVGPTPSPSVGWSATPVSVGRRPWPSAWPTRSSTPATVSAPRPSAVKTFTRWPSPTRPSPTTAGRGHPQLHRWGASKPAAPPSTGSATAGPGRGM